MYSQSSIDYNSYMESARNSSLIFRGRAAELYQFPYKGSFYIEDLEYLQGELFYNNKYYKDLYLNVNAHQDELYIKSFFKDKTLVLTKKDVKWFTMGDKKYINFSETGKLMPSGYYEVLFQRDSIVLYKKTVKEFRKELSNKVEIYFVPLYSYFLKKGEEYYRVKGENSLIKLISGDRKEIKRALSRMKFYTLNDREKEREQKYVFIMNFK